MGIVLSSRLLSRLPRKSLVLGLGALGLATTLTAAALLSDGPAAARVAPRQPAAGEVMAQVDADGRAISRAVGQLAAGDVRARVELARKWIAKARQSADPRHLGRAQAALAPWWSRDELPDEVRLLRATISQSLHDFAAARRDLDALVPRRPDDVQLHLTRAAVAAVTADYDAALASCEAVSASAPPLVAAACKAPVQLVLGRAELAYRELRALDEQAAAPSAGAASAGAASAETAGATPTDDDSTAGRGLRAWVATTLGELAAALGEPDAAAAHFARALALAPDAYTRAALADLHLDGGHPERVAALFTPAAPADAAAAAALVEIDGLLLRLTIAETRLGASAAAAHAATLRERFAATVARGDLTHRREQGMFELDVEGNAALALEHLTANWQLQKEPIDARLLVRAAAAARAPEAAAPVRAWIERTGIRDAALDAALQALDAVSRTGGPS